MSDSCTIGASCVLGVRVCGSLACAHSQFCDTPIFTDYDVFPGAVFANQYGAILGIGQFINDYAPSYLNCALGSTKNENKDNMGVTRTPLVKPCDRYGSV